MEIAHTQFLRETPERKIIRCPKCQSVYVDAGECESCGFRLNLDRLGDPLGERSFYAISDTYREEHSLFGIEIPKFLRSKEKKERYLRQLNFRLGVLLDYFLSDRDGNTTRRRVFWTELKSVIWEMITSGVSHNKIADRIESHPGHTEYRIVSSEILNYLMDCGQAEWERDRIGQFFSYRLFGTLRAAPLLILLGVAAVVIFSSLSYYQYFFAMN